MRLLDAAAGSAEHGAARRGRITGSVIDTIMCGSFKRWNALAAELRNGSGMLGGLEHVPAIAWGNKHEAQARGLFWQRHPHLDVDRPAFAYYWDEADPVFSETVGCSPDLIILDAPPGTPLGGQIKCPYSAEVHEKYRLLNACPEEYYPQVQFEAWNNNSRAGWYFISYDPREQDGRDYHEVIVPWDQDYIYEMQSKILRFLEGFQSGEDFAPPSRTVETFKAAF